MTDTPDTAARLKAMNDDELFDELRMIVNDARNYPSYDRKLAQAIGTECRSRGWLTNIPSDLPT